MSMSELADKLGVDRGKIYRSMERLEKLGVVVLKNSKITVCEAIPPDKALYSLIEKKKKHVVHLKKISKNISNELEKITRNHMPLEIPSFSLIEGRNSIYTKIGKFIQDAKNSIYFVTTTKDFLIMMHTAIPEKIRLAKNKGIVFRVIVDDDDNNLCDAMMLCSIDELKVGKLPSKSRMIVEKNNQLLMSGTIKETNSLIESSETMLYSNSSEMATNLFSLCEQLWKNTKKIISISAKN